MKKKTKKRSEFSEQYELCQWIKENYPSALFYSDNLSGGVLPIHIASMKKKMCNPDSGWPDMMFYDQNHGFVGMALEYKRVGTSVVKKDGGYRNIGSVLIQSDFHRKLRSKNWLVGFCIGLDHAKQIISSYYSCNLKSTLL